MSDHMTYRSQVLDVLWNEQRPSIFYKASTKDVRDAAEVITEMLVEARRKGAVQALRDAAEFAGAEGGRWWFDNEQWAVKAWLVERADQTEQGEL